MFLEDEPPPNAALIEYIPDMQILDLSNYSKQYPDRLLDILLQLHQVRVLHGGPYPRNMMIRQGQGCQGQKGRALWIDFDKAQTLPKDQPLTARNEKWFRLEVDLMQYFAENLVCLLILYLALTDCHRPKIMKRAS